jgi:mono/diheme cytochrome c family protein
MFHRAMLCVSAALFCATSVAILAQEKPLAPKDEPKQEPKTVKRLDVPEAYAQKIVPDLKDADRIARGKALFADATKANCEMCHGAGGKGDGPQAPNYTDPAVTNLTDVKFHDAVTDQYIFWRVKDAQGSKADVNSGMLGYPNGTDEELWSIVAYVRSLKAPEIKVLSGASFENLMEEMESTWAALQKAATAKGADKTWAEAIELEALTVKALGYSGKDDHGKLVREHEAYKKFVEEARAAIAEYAALVKNAEWDKAAAKQDNIEASCDNCHDVYN